MEIGYQYTQHKKTGHLSINSFKISNLRNNDFIEMDVQDLVYRGVPMLYVDLIQGVVMEDEGAWKAAQIIQVIQDIFKLVKLPGEK